ncbi:ThuA domain-containing protein [bacterium]|nr:ThuA domain-containing protein [bacterium]
MMLFIPAGLQGEDPPSTNVLVVVGGKSFETAPFYAMFGSFEGVRSDTASKPGVFSLFASTDVARYDVIVFYDSYQPITESQRNSFLSLLDRGIGCVFLHHALVSHQEWKEYEKILGGRYHHAPYVDGGKKYGASTYKHDQEFTVQVVDPSHPVTRGIADFPIHDEIYINYQVFDFVTPLLTVDHRESGRPTGWAHRSGNSRVVYLQSGHDHRAYENPGFRALLLNAIRWVAKGE